MNDLKVATRVYALLANIEIYVTSPSSHMSRLVIVHDFKKKRRLYGEFGRKIEIEDRVFGPPPTSNHVMCA